MRWTLHFGLLHKLTWYSDTSYYLFSTTLTPEKQRPAVLFRKRLGRCKHTEPPRSLDKRLLISAAQLHQAVEVKGHCGPQRGHPESPVQKPAWISSGCWLRPQERAQQRGRKTKATRHFYRSLSKSLDKEILMSLLRWGVFILVSLSRPYV